MDGRGPMASLCLTVCTQVCKSLCPIGQLGTLISLLIFLRFPDIQKLSGNPRVSIGPMCGSACPPRPCMVWPWKAGNPGHWRFHRAWPSGSCPLLCTCVPLAVYGPLGGLSTLAHSQFFLGPFQDWPFFLNASCLGSHRSCTFSHCSSSADSIFSLEVVTTGLGEPCSRNWAFGN